MLQVDNVGQLEVNEWDVILLQCKWQTSMHAPCDVFILPMYEPSECIVMWKHQMTSVLVFAILYVNKIISVKASVAPI